MLPYFSTPLQEIRHPQIEKAGIRLLIKREDLNHPTVSGNKWWKLKYNLQAARSSGATTLLTFGGAYSNHLYATASAGKLCGFQTIGIIRGEPTFPLNSTLSFLKKNGMDLHWINRGLFRQKGDPEFLKGLERQFGHFYLLPEGGTNNLAVKGVSEFSNMLATLEFDYLFSAVGTGGTLSGLIHGLKGKGHVVGIPVLKNGEFLFQEIQHWLNAMGSPSLKNWSLLTAYHFGGYGKYNPELLSFIKQLKEQFELPLDQVYTGKMLWALFKQIEKGFFKRGDTLLALHSGGLQGSLLKGPDP